MAREEADREDLLREATALVERVELTLQDHAAHNGPETVIIGFRAGGAASFFFGTEPVYQFNANGELRRAYSAGRLYMADRGKLIALKRVRTAREVQLQRHELNEAERNEFMNELKKRLGELAAALVSGRYEIVGQVPGDADILGKTKKWLAGQMWRRIASAPYV